jgi:hypothetical protein
MSRIKLATPKTVYARRNDLSDRAFRSHCRVRETEAYRVSRHDKGDSLLSNYWLLCPAPVMHQRLFRGSQHEIISYDNEFTVKWRRGFDWKQRS